MNQRGFMVPPQLIVVLLIVVIGGGAVLAYNHAIAKAERMEQELNAAREVAAQYAGLLEQQREAVEAEHAARAEAEREMAAAREKVAELEGLFARHDLDHLLQKKPGLIVPRANAATERMHRELEAAAAD